MNYASFFIIPLELNPPSMGKTVPLIYEDPGKVKNNDAEATSSGKPYLFWGIFCKNALLVSLSCIFFTNSVSIAPGHNVLTVILYGDNSMDRTLLNAITPPFDAP